jgi:uncharacterized delta-60 repeat protein
MDRAWKAALGAVAVLCAIFAVMVGGATAAKPAPKTTKPKGGTPGQLDPSFGTGGKVTAAFPAESSGSTAPKYTLPFEFKPGHLEMAQAPGGKVVVAGATKIVRYTKDGKLDPTFGKGGTVTVPRPPGDIFVLAGIAVDSQGRIVLAGLARPLPQNSTPDPLLSQATVMRFSVNGTLDATFGSGGMVVTDLGLGAPKAVGGPYIGASVGLRDVVIDSQDRPVVSGAYVSEVGTGGSSAISKGFVARLTDTGALDQSFGEKGLRTISPLVSLGQLESFGKGFLTLAERSERPHNLIAGIDENGNLETGFAAFGFRTVQFLAAPTLSVAPSGKILLLGRPEEHRAYRNRKYKNDEGEIKTERVRYYVKRQTVRRLLPSGAGDPSFGHSGSLTFTDPKAGTYGAATVDSKERIYLAGRVAKGGAKAAKKGAHRTKFLVGRLTPKGQKDTSFGNGGTIATDFGKSADSFATQVTLDPKGRVLVGGGIESPQLETGSGFALVRYLP